MNIIKYFDLVVYFQKNIFIIFDDRGPLIKFYFFHEI